MKKLVILRNPVDLNNVALDDLEEDSGNWQLKAERLIQRRQKRLRLKNA